MLVTVDLPESHVAALAEVAVACGETFDDVLETAVGNAVMDAKNCFGVEPVGFSLVAQGAIQP